MPPPPPCVLLSLLSLRSFLPHSIQPANQTPSPRCGSAIAMKALNIRSDTKTMIIITPMTMTLHGMTVKIVVMIDNIFVKWAAVAPTCLNLGPSVVYLPSYTRCCCMPVPPKCS